MESNLETNHDKRDLIYIQDMLKQIYECLSIVLKEINTLKDENKSTQRAVAHFRNDTKENRK